MDLTFYQRKITYAFLKLSISLSIIHIDFPKIDDSAAPKLSTTDTLFRHTLHIYLFIYLLAHLSRRLIGELIVYQWSGVRRSSIRPSSFTMLKDLLLRNRWSDQSQILCGASLGRGERYFVRDIWVDFHETWYVASGTPAHHSLFK